MKKFKYAEGVTGFIYETLNELLSRKDINVYERSGKYYVYYSENGYGNVYEVNKHNGKATKVNTIDFLLDIEPNAKRINPATLKKEH